MAIKLHHSFAIHPGPWLHRNAVQAHGFNVTSTAKHLGVTRGAMHNLLHGKSALSAEMAIRFEKAFGISAETMLRMQASHDLAIAKQTAKDTKVKRVPEPILEHC